MIYALGIPALTMVIIFVINSSDWIPDKFKLKVGTSSCFVSSKFDSFDWKPITTNQPIIIYISDDFLGQVIYLYGPLAIILGFNIFFFILTSLKIRQIQNDLRRPTLEEKSQQHRMNLNSNIHK